MAVVLDGEGRIAACTATWLAAAEVRGLDLRAVDVGADYLAACDGAAHDDPAAAAVADGIRAVLRGDERQLSFDYECSGPDERRWFTVRVAQLVGPGSGAMVTHLDITDVRAAELSVRGQFHELWNVVDPAADFAFLLDQHGEVLGRTKDASQPEQWPVAGQSAFDFVHADDGSRLRELLSELASAPGERTSSRFRARGPGDRAWRHYKVTATNMVEDPTVGGIVVALDDVTGGLRTSASSALAQALTDEIAVSALATDDAGIVIAVNAGACVMMGAEAADVLGRPIGDFVRAVSTEEASALRRSVADDGEWFGEIEILRSDESVVPIGARVRVLHDTETGFSGRSYIALDQTREHDLRAALVEHQMHDELTGLGNPAAFRNDLRQLVRGLNPDQEAAVAKIGLDRFSDVNTLHGAHVGDVVLREVGAALRQAVSPGGTVARLYGDMFAVASAPGVDPETFGAVVQKAIEGAHDAAEIAVHVTASVGVRVVTHRDDDPEDVLADLRMAVDAAKEAGGRTVRHYDEALRQLVDERAMLRRDLATALDRDEISVVYQPIVRLEDGLVVGTEALLRWNHPTAGSIPPDVFIPLAEQSPVIHDLGAHVLDDACRHAARWNELRPELPVSVAVNLSASQLADAALADRVTTAISDHQLYPSAITLELTESMLIDFEGASTNMVRLKATGVRIAIDDFGTGHSSLSRLKELPLDVVKVDRSFVTGIGASPADASIMRTVVSLADAFGVDIVAEGVETVGDAEALRSLGCAFGQGYLWSTPVPPADIDEVIHRPFPAVEAVEVADRNAEEARAATEALRTIKHELNAPLAVLTMAVDLRDTDGTLPRDSVDIVARNVDRANRLVEDLEILDRLDHGTLRPEVRAFDLAGVARSVVERLRVATGREIQAHLPDELRADGDPSLIDVVITNLVTNAVKYSTAPDPVQIHLSFADRAVHLEVHDRGPGIPPDRLGNIWRKFGRLTYEVPGSGIGLYLVRGIARAHGGDVRYRPGAGGQGSIFTLHLPLDR